VPTQLLNSLVNRQIYGLCALPPGPIDSSVNQQTYGTHCHGLPATSTPGTFAGDIESMNVIFYSSVPHQRQTYYIFISADEYVALLLSAIYLSVGSLVN
jgi:hypothetical protein